MKITVDQQEIEKAIVAFVGELGIPIDGKNVTVAITAGRGPNGLSAEIDISGGTAGTTSSKATKIVPPVETAVEVPVKEESSDDPEPTDAPKETEQADEEKPLFGGG